MKLGELENFQPAINLILGYKDKMIEYLQKNNASLLYDSRHDFVMKMLKGISK